MLLSFRFHGVSMCPCVQTRKAVGQLAFFHVSSLDALKVQETRMFIDVWTLGHLEGAGRGKKEER
jgi:hypothetical protein